MIVLNIEDISVVIVWSTSRSNAWRPSSLGLEDWLCDLGATWLDSCEWWSLVHQLLSWLSRKTFVLCRRLWSHLRKLRCSSLVISLDRNRHHCNMSLDLLKLSLEAHWIVSFLKINCLNWLYCIDLWRNVSWEERNLSLFVLFDNP